MKSIIVITYLCLICFVSSQETGTTTTTTAKNIKEVNTDEITTDVLDDTTVLINKQETTIENETNVKHEIKTQLPPPPPSTLQPPSSTLALENMINNVSQIHMDNTTIIMKLCMDVLRDNATCTKIYNLCINENYFQLTWELTYRMFFERPFGIVIFILWTIILCILNFVILFVCTLLRPLRRILLVKIVSDLRRRYYFANDAAEMKIIDENNRHT